MAEDPKKVLTLEDDGPPEPPPPDPPVPIAQQVMKVAVLGFATVGLFGLFFGGGMAVTYLMKDPPKEVIRGGKVLVMPVVPRTEGYDGAADAITGVLVERLSKVEGLEVSPLSKTNGLKDDERKADEIAKAEGVRYVVQPGLRWSDGNVGLDVVLVLSGGEGEQSGGKLSETYKKPESEFYGALDQALTAIAKGTDLELEGAVSMDRPTEKPDHWLKAHREGFNCVNPSGEGDDAKAKATEAATALAATAASVNDWPGAHEWLAKCQAKLGDPAKAAEAAAKAVELGSTDAEVKGLAKPQP